MRQFKWGSEAVLLALLVTLLALAFKLDPQFLSMRVQVEALSSIWEVALLAIPMTLIVLTGGIDLSVGSTMSLAAVALGMAFEAKLPLAFAVLIALAVGTACGALNGLFVAKVRVHPLIVTLATLSAFYGLAEGVSQARPISGFPQIYLDLFARNLGFVSLTGWLTVAVSFIGVLVLAKTVFGQALFAIGLNELAVKYSGIRVDRIKFLAYTLAGSAAGFAAVSYTARRNTAKADIGQGIELDVITAVVLGGTSIYGGRGSLFGTLLGVLLVHETRQFVSWHWEKDELNFIVVGTLLVVAVVVNRLFETARKQAK